MSRTATVKRPTQSGAAAGGAASLGELAVLDAAGLTIEATSVGMAAAGGNATTETRTYNAFNQLTGVTRSDMMSLYVYRGDGLRHSKTVNSKICLNLGADPILSKTA